ncbi:calcium/sodium antiporter [Geoalkalibacter sp.]|uniref:calcium/sodium antiporter n=1 Tax=Geoalkalibacter sp. TaxID=3041440 RepID=UPI00272E2BBE|nr:calcium/sodium antiporter [Geoalkalibacter sp.]
MDLLTLALFLVGLVALIGGAELLVRGASALAAAWGISPLVIGLTVVAFGTSAPELAVSVLSAWNGQPGIAMGNVVGSNIANVLLILGLSALAAPLLVARQVVRLEVPIMIGTSLLLVLLALDGRVGRIDGFLLFGGCLAYTVWTVRRSRREEHQNDVPAPASGNPWLQGGLILAGLVCLGVGSHWLVNGAVAIARIFGVSDLVIGLTVVAVGTSLPELATSVLASLRGQRDIAVGNVVGSNIFNILCVLGLSAAVVPGGVPVALSALTFDLPVMVAVALACLPIFFTGHLIARWEGGLFFLYYLAYVGYLVLNAVQHQSLPLLRESLVFFFLPLTAVTLAISLWRHRR